jgi:protein Mpv17
MENPVQTKMLTGGILAFCGDAIAQSREPRYDEKRAVAFVSFDVVYRAVQCSLFPMITDTCDGHFISHFFPTMDIRSLATMEQTFANQFIVVPFIYYPVFFTLTGSLQGLSLDDTLDRARSTLFPLLKRNWLFWIPVQYFQFGYVEEPLQIPFLCVAGLAWTIILSALAGSVKNYNSNVISNSNNMEVEASPTLQVLTVMTKEEELSTESVQV